MRLPKHYRGYINQLHNNNHTHNLYSALFYIIMIDH